LPASDGAPPKEADAEVEILPKPKDGAEAKDGPGPKAVASTFLELMAMQTGAAALASNFTKLPESIQKQTLDNESERNRLAYEFEGKRLAAEAADRESERKDELARLDRAIAHEAEQRRRVFWFTAAVVAAGAIGSGLLGWAGQRTLAQHLINSMASGGLGYLAGKGLKSTGQRQLPPGRPHDKDDE